MARKLLAILVFIMVTSLSAAGCIVNTPGASSPTPTPTSTPMPTVSTPMPPADYSSYFDKWFEGGNAIVDRSFTKSTNVRGNDVYKGMTRNSSAPESYKMTTVIELTKSQAEAKQLYDNTVAQKSGEGFTLRPDWVAFDKAQFAYLTNVWEGQHYGTGQVSAVWCYYDSYVHSWIFLTHSR